MTNDNGLPATPLEGIRLLDLGRYQAGPRCALMFARMGAEVIKIEGLSGDESRASGPRVRGQSAYWVQYNSGKKSLSINLRTEEGKDVLRDLVRVSDILLQNFRPGTIEKMGFGYDVLQELNPRIVMINVSAYGQYGPYSERVGFDQIGQALGGLMWMTGFPDDPPIKTYFPLIDRITSLHATIGALAALRERDISGRGQAIDVCLADTGFTVNEIPISAYLGDGIEEKREGNGSGLGNSYATSDGWVYITAASDNMWPRVCDALGRPEWRGDARFATREARGGARRRAGERAGQSIHRQDYERGGELPVGLQHPLCDRKHHRGGRFGPPRPRAGDHGGGARSSGRQHSRHGQDDQVQPHANGGRPDPGRWAAHARNTLRRAGLQRRTHRGPQRCRSHPLRQR